MACLSPSLYARWRAPQFAPSALHEAQAPAAPGERLLQQIWLHQRLVRDGLRSLDGRPLRVLHPGFWNHEAGPDFREAVVQIGGEPAVSGDIELDLTLDCWRQHRHDQNPAYRNVRLHVVWQAPAGAATDLPTLALHCVLDSPLPELQAWLSGAVEPDLPASQIGQCAGPLRALPGPWLVELLKQAARVRLESKAVQFQARARQAGWEQALWEGLLTALGYKQNVWPMRRLGELVPRLAPAAELPSRSVLGLQARLLGVAGLLPAELTRAQSATDRYMRRVWDDWWREREAFEDASVPRAAWRFHGLRPANHPQRRLALAAHWLNDGNWLSRLETWFKAEVASSRLAETLLDCLQVKQDEFWSWHWTLRAVRMARPQPLLGAQRVTDLAINVILPWFWMRAVAGKNEPLRERVEQRYFAWPAGEDNAVLRRARQRLLGGGRPSLPRTAAMQQGLLQIVRDFCDHSNALCEDCRLPGLVKGLSLAPNKVVEAD